FDQDGMCYPEDCPFGDGPEGACDTRECSNPGFEFVPAFPGTTTGFCFPEESSSSSAGSASSAGESSEGGGGSSEPSGGGSSSSAGAPGCPAGFVQSPYNS